MRGLALRLCWDAVDRWFRIVVRWQGYGTRVLPLPAGDYGGRLVGAIRTGAGAEEGCGGAEDEVGVDAAGEN